MGIEGKKNILGSREYLVNPTVDGTILGPITGCLGASCYVVANDTKAEVKAHAQALHDAGYPVWVCDGIDDQVEIQAAIDALPAGGGKVLLMEGTYHVSAFIIVTANTFLEGVGWSTIIRSSVMLTSHMIHMQSNTSLRNLTANMYFHEHSAVIVTHASNVLIEGNRLLNGYTIVFTNASNNVRIINNHIEWNAPFGDGQLTGDAIGPFQSHSLVISGNTIIQVPLGEGIDLQRVTNSVVSNNVIRGGNFGITIHLPPVPPVGVLYHHNVISGNVFSDIRGVGISVQEGIAIIDGNVIHTEEAIGRAAGIWLASGARESLVTNNIIENAVYGMQLTGDLENTLISNNRVLNIGGIWVPYGIIFDGVVSNVVIDSNFFESSDSRTRLIFGLHHLENIHITNNILRAEGGFTVSTGIALPQSTSTGIIVKGNRFHGVFTIAEYINNSQNPMDSSPHTDLFMDVLAASSNHIHPAITPDGLAHTDVTSPDVPRNVMIRIANTDGVNAQMPSGGNMVIEGVDARGRTTSETLVVPATSIPAGGTLDVFGSKAFATINRVTYYSETNTAITVSVGISDKLGLSNVIYAAGDVYKVKKGNADVPVGTVDVANGTVDCATIVSGDDFTIYYRSNLNILA